MLDESWVQGLGPGTPYKAALHPALSPPLCRLGSPCLTGEMILPPRSILVGVRTLTQEWAALGGVEISALPEGVYSTEQQCLGQLAPLCPEVCWGHGVGRHEGEILWRPHWYSSQGLGWQAKANPAISRSQAGPPEKCPGWSLSGSWNEIGCDPLSYLSCGLPGPVPPLLYLRALPAQQSPR